MRAGLRIGQTLRLTAALASLALSGCAGSPAGSPAPVLRAGSTLRLPDLKGPPEPPARVLLISVAGLSPQDYRTDFGPPRMPTLAELGRRGVYADAVATVSPASIHPVHASLVTGRRPNLHGVVADHLLGERGVRRARYEDASRLVGPSLWQVARDAQLSVAALGWPTTTGANVDLLLPDVQPTAQGQSWLDAVAGSATPWLAERVASAAPSPLPYGWPAASQLDRLVVDLACEIARSPAVPALWLIRLEQAGVALRAYGPGSDAANLALERVDREVARLGKCLDRAGLLESSALVVTGDRAVLPVHTEIYPNTALARAGLIQVDSLAPSGVVAWSAIVRSSGGTALIYAQGEDDAISARRALDAAARETRAFRVVAASELRERGADPQAWFGLDAELGYHFGDTARGPLARPSTDRGASGFPTDGIDSEVGFVAWGRGIRSAVRVPELPQVDIGPTVAQLLGLRLPDAEGRAMLGVLTPLSRVAPAAPRP